MKKISVLILVLAFVTVACGGDDPPATETTTPDQPVTESTETPTNGDTDSAKNPTSTLSPEQIDLASPIAAADLQQAVAADEAAWQGTEVTVLGKNNGQSVSQVESGQIVLIGIAPLDGGESLVDCSGDKTPPENSLRATVYRGTVAELAYGRVLLESCEVVE